MVDPIYLGLAQERDEVNKAYDAAIKSVASAKKEMGMAIPQTGELRVRQGQFFDAEKALADVQQKKRFLEVHLKSRKEFSRKAYDIAFKKDEEWPNQEEHRLYQANRKLNTDPKSWDERLKIYFDSRRAPAADPKKAAGGGGH